MSLVTSSWYQSTECVHFAQRIRPVHLVTSSIELISYPDHRLNICRPKRYHKSVPADKDFKADVHSNIFSTGIISKVPIGVEVFIG